MYMPKFWGGLYFWGGVLPQKSKIYSELVTGSTFGLEPAKENKKEGERPRQKVWAAFCPVVALKY